METSQKNGKYFKYQEPKISDIYNIKFVSQICIDYILLLIISFVYKAQILYI